MFAGGVIRRDGRANGDTAVLGDFRGNVADAPDVNVAVLLGKAELGRQMLAHQVAIQQGDRTSTGLQELGEQNVGDGRLTGTRKSGEEDGHALFGPGRETAAQFSDDFRVGEPGGNLAAFAQTLAKLSAGDVQYTIPVLDFVVRDVFVLRLEVH